MVYVTAVDVSKLLLAWSNQNGDLITNLKLQKLLYYAQAWHLVNFDKPVFLDPIEAWEFGPVIPEVYRKWKIYKSNPIRYRSNRREEDLFTQGQLKFLRNFFPLFSNLSATALVNMTHNEVPWKEAYARGANNVISTDSMKAYYRGVYERTNGNQVSQ